MKQQDQAQVLQYLEKFSGVFNDMAQDVFSRVLGSAESNGLNPAANESVTTKVKIDPQVFIRQQVDFLQKQQMLWQSASRAMLGEEMPNVIEPPTDDKRFSDRDWTGNPVFSYLKQAYLLNAEYMNQLVDSFEFEDKQTADQVRFYTRQFVNSMSPSNYVLTNPEVCREILETEGDSLARGIDNFMRDLENSPAEAFKITQVKADAFQLGKDLATTPGKVVFRNQLIELLQYSPATDEVFENPLLIIPPFINKYYILDLNEEKSLVKWLVGQGYTVFMVSWVNPDESLRYIQFQDYIQQGVVAALDVVTACANVDKINVAGYCVGGTVLAAAQAYLQSVGDSRIQSLSLLTTLLDFAEPGEVGNYISEHAYTLLEKNLDDKGFLDGRVLALSFSLLRENNLFWSFFIDHYLKGKDPVPFDILYWNSDSTNIPGPTYLYYLRNMYMDNKLTQPNALEVAGVPIDLKNITTPTYCLAAMADHIVPWTGAYASARAIGGNVRFVLTESGHVAGVVNPAARGKYPHWVNDSLPGSGRDWLAGAKQHAGSWWNDWHQWLEPRSGSKRAPRKPGCKKFPQLGSAPGEYVKVRLEARFASIMDPVE